MLDLLNEMKKQSIKTCNKERLVDLQTIKIDTSKSVTERIIDFIYQVRNPYLFKVGDVAVKIVFDEHGESFQKKFESLIAANLIT